MGKNFHSEIIEFLLVVYFFFLNRLSKAGFPSDDMDVESCQGDFKYL